MTSFGTKIEYHDNLVEVWYNCEDEYFYGEVKICVNQTWILAVMTADKNRKDLIRHLKEKYNDFVFGYNLAMAGALKSYRLKYPTEDKKFEDLR